MSRLEPGTGHPVPGHDTGPVPPITDAEALHTLRHLPGPVATGHLPEPLRSIAEALLELPDDVDPPAWLHRKHAVWCEEVALQRDLDDLIQAVRGRLRYEQANPPHDHDPLAESFARHPQLTAELRAGEPHAAAHVLAQINQDATLGRAVTAWMRSNRQRSYRALARAMAAPGPGTADDNDLDGAASAFHVLVRAMWPSPSTDIGATHRVTALGQIVDGTDDLPIHLELAELATGADDFTLVVDAELRAGHRQRVTSPVGVTGEQRTAYQWSGFTSVTDDLGNAYALVRRERVPNGGVREVARQIVRATYRPALSRHARTLKLSSGGYEIHTLTFDGSGGRPQRQVTRSPVTLAATLAIPAEPPP